ncbi:MAG: M48 family metalloprotease [Bdellovibrionales bacterium]|nr:M48 family metalloprotease [Bdellovibrionales bacterium]
MQRFLSIAVRTVAGFLVLVSCSATPLEQDGGDLTRSEVEFLQRKLSEAMEAHWPPLAHKKVTRYVDALGQAIVARNPSLPPLPYEFVVLRSADVLTASLPGGKVYVTLGLLQQVEYEGELAASLAHELAHQHAGHSLRVWRGRVNAARPAQIILETNGPFEKLFLGKDSYLDLGAEFEREADETAPALLYRAGFDPRTYGSFLQIVRRLEKSRLALVQGLVSLHPPADDRVAWAREASLTLPPSRDPKVSSASFQEIKIILRKVEALRGR